VALAFWAPFTVDDRLTAIGLDGPPWDRQGRCGMRFVMGSDDEDPLVEHVAGRLEAGGHVVRRIDTADWPVVAKQVAEAVARGDADQGVLFCWTGTGTSIAANKVPGVRAALAWDPWIAEGARRWNDANVLVMSLKRTSPEQADQIVEAWLSVTEPDEDEIGNINAVE
jgi:ribose 5-phosphate isomerase B